VKNEELMIRFISIKEYYLFDLMLSEQEIRTRLKNYEKQFVIAITKVKDDHLAAKFSMVIMELKEILEIKEKK
jgi:hypothetical protein